MARGKTGQTTGIAVVSRIYRWLGADRMASCIPSPLFHEAKRARSRWVRGTVGQTGTKMWSRPQGSIIVNEKHHDMTTKALFVKLEAKPGKENEVAKFLRDGQGLVQQEPETIAWFGIQLGKTTFAIFDAFQDDAGRDAHLSGKVAKALMEKAPELLAEPPKIEKVDVLADRLPG
jgi:quinol monooxygenase YgiN